MTGETPLEMGSTMEPEPMPVWMVELPMTETGALLEAELSPDPVWLVVGLTTTDGMAVVEVEMLIAGFVAGKPVEMTLVWLEAVTLGELPSTEITMTSIATIKD